MSRPADPTTGQSLADQPTTELPPVRGDGSAAPRVAPTPAPSPGTLRKRSRSAVAPSVAGDRSLAIVIGLVLLALGALVALLSFAVFGAERAGLPVLDPVVLDALRSQALIAQIIALVVGLLLLVLGLRRVFASLRPEPRPDVVLEQGPGTAIHVRSSAAADAVAEQASSLPGVARAKARVVGTEGAPALRVTVWLTEDADVREVCRRLDEDILDGVRSSLGMEALPVAVRLELDTSGDGPRVA